MTVVHNVTWVHGNKGYEMRVYDSVNRWEIRFISTIIPLMDIFME